MFCKPYKIDDFKICKLHIFKYDLNILDYNEKYQSSDIQEEVL